MVDLHRIPRAPDPDVWTGSLAGWDVPELPGALCAQTDPDEWFPEQGGSTALAKAICRQCPVTGECLEWALDHQETFGVWGGLSEQERKPLRRRVA